MKNWTLVAVLALSLGLAAAIVAADTRETAGLTVVVMDPLAAPLSCPCVQGYAQRDYDKLGQFLENELGRPVTVAFSESLTAALKKKTEGKADLIIGKYSVVLADAGTNKLKLHHVAMLTGKDGNTMQTGLIVVPSKDPAKSVADLKGYRIFFGPAECDEKHKAALQLMKDCGVPIPTKIETCAGCDEGATKILEMGGNGAAVISSYAAPLLEGCNTVPRGALRLVGVTEPQPFVAAFVNDAMSSTDRESVVRALLKVSAQPSLLVALETQKGFVRAETQEAKKK